MQFFTFFLLKTHFIRKYFILLYYFFQFILYDVYDMTSFLFPTSSPKNFFMNSLNFFFSTLTQTLAHTHVINYFAKKTKTKNSHKNI